MKRNLRRTKLKIWRIRKILTKLKKNKHSMRQPTMSLLVLWHGPSFPRKMRTKEQIIIIYLVKN